MQWNSDVEFYMNVINHEISRGDTVGVFFIDHMPKQKYDKYHERLVTSIFNFFLIGLNLKPVHLRIYDCTFLIDDVYHS